MKEVNSDCKKKHLNLITKGKVALGELILDTFWYMKRRCDITGGKVYKCKSILNVHGRQH